MSTQRITLFTAPDNDKIPFPPWARRRVGWIYSGWTPRFTDISFLKPFKERIKMANRSDHGELREADIYPEGATFWTKETGKPSNKTLPPFGGCY